MNLTDKEGLMITEEEVRAFLSLQERIGEVADDLARLYYASKGWNVEFPSKGYGLEEVDQSNVTVVYRDYADTDRMSFPLQMLWDPEFRQQVEVEKARQEAAKVEKERQLAEKQRQAIEAKEKAQLATLLEKYGRPEE